MATRTGSFIEIRRGETATFVFPVKDAAGAAINCSGASIKFRIAAKRTLSDYVINIASGSGQLSLVNVSGTNDGIQVALTETDTKQTPGKYHSEIKVTLAGNAKVTAEWTTVILDSLTDD